MKRPRDDRIRRHLRRLRSRFWYRSLDAIYTAPTRPDQGTFGFLRESVEPRGSNYRRVGAMARLLEAGAPALAARLRASLTREVLPVRAASASPFAFGSGSTCVRLSSTPPTVLKVFRASLGAGTEELLEEAARLRDEYRTLRRWYADLPRLLPATHHLVLHCPLRAIPVAARLQALVPAPTHDVLVMPQDALVRTLAEHRDLAAEFRAFVRATVRAREDEQRAIDLVGPGNVVLALAGARPELRLIDFGLIDFSATAVRAQGLDRLADRAIERLVEISERLTP